MNKKKYLFNFLIAIVAIMIFSFSPSPIKTYISGNIKMSDRNNEPNYPAVFPVNENDKNWIETTLSKMSIHDKCAQMIMPWVLGNYMNEDSDEFIRLKKLVKEDKVGGLIFFKGDIMDEAIAINKMQKFAKIPLLIASDFERGLAMRLRDAIEYPYNMAVAATNDPLLAYKMGRNVSIECRAIGVSQNYSPVADINNNPENPIINIRSYSESKSVVSEFCDNFIKGANSERVLTTAKHFPGHGDTRIDSHQEIPVISQTKDEIWNNELVPFISSINSGVKSIMVGHLSVPALDSTNDLPATLSKTIITNLLKDHLNFKGLVITDAMNMSAITKHYSVGEATVMAVKAGNDIILMPPDEDVALSSLVDAVNSGEIKISQIDESVRKILAAKRWLRLEEKRYSDLDKLTKIVNNKSHLRLAEEIAEKSITLVKNDKRLIPIEPERTKSVACITVTDGMESDSDLLFQKYVKGNFSNVRTFVLNKKSRTRDYQKALRIARESKIVFLPSIIYVKAYQGTVNLSKKNSNFIKEVLRHNSSAVLISFGNPYMLSAFPNAKTYLCSYGNPPVSQQAMLKAIIGEITVQGKLPITIPNTKYKIGDGIDIKRTKLFYSKPDIDSSFDFSNIEKLITSGISQKIIPGAELLIAKNGEVIFNKAFGKTTFTENSNDLSKESIFNIGSISESIATVTSALYLIEKGKLNLNNKISKYFPVLSKTLSNEIKVQNLIEQNSGLTLNGKTLVIRGDKNKFNSMLQEIKIKFPHGTKFEYSRINLILLQAIIEKITGEKFDKFSYTKIFKPLGMNRTLNNIPRELKFKSVPLYSNNDNNNVGAKPENQIDGLYSDAEDLAVFSQMILQNGTYGKKIYLNSEAIKKWIDLQQSINGFTINNSASLKNNFTGPAIWLDMSQNLSVILLTNRNSDINALISFQQFKSALYNSILKAVKI